MPNRVEDYRQQLRRTQDVEAFLRGHSGLPGPRGNLELAHAFADEGSPKDIRRFAALEPREAPENTPGVFLAFCGVLGLSRLLVEGDKTAEPTLRARASDPRWRVREAVATALQRVGDVDRDRYNRMVTSLAGGSALERRAALAALAEPRLLSDARAVRTALRLLDRVTRSLTRAARPLADPEQVLRQALAYAWSVVVAADPGPGKPAMEAWLASADPDIRWVMRQNLTKNRLQKMDRAWCLRWAKKLAAPARLAAKTSARTSRARRP